MTTIDPSLVAQLPLFAGFNANELGEILRDARSARVTKNNAVFQQGEEAHSFYVLLHGHLRASKTTPTGEQVVVRYVASGETFGVAMAIGLQRYPATATRSMTAWYWRGHRPRGRDLWRNSRPLPPTRYIPSAAGCRKHIPA
jgi:CRP-like cAMP-binding protein